MQAPARGSPALADDSGLLVDELKGWAGVRSARLYEDWLDQRRRNPSPDDQQTAEDSLAFHARYQQGQISHDEANFFASFICCKGSGMPWALTALVL